MTIHASKARFAKWESIVTTARLIWSYNNALLLRGYQLPHPIDCATCRAFALDPVTTHTSYGGTD